jgi:hypothetical protein
MLARVICVADHDDFAQMAEIFARDGLQLLQKSFADDSYMSAGVVEDIFVIVRFGLGVDGNGDGADFDGAEKGVEKFGRIEKQEEDALFWVDTEIAKRVAGTVGAFEELLVGDALVAAFDGDVLRAAFENVAVHEVGGDVEEMRQVDHVAAMFAARWRRKIRITTSLQGRRVDSIRSTRFGAAISNPAPALPWCEARDVICDGGS